MTVYKYDKTLKVGKKQSQRTLLITTVIVLIVGVVAYLLIIRNNDSGTVDGKAVRVSNDPHQDFTTKYFKFTVSKSWDEAPDLGNNIDTFVYRKYLQSNPLGILTIKVNAGVPNLITNVVPLKIESGKIANIGTLSDHCSKFVPPGSNLDPHTVVTEDVTFRCWTDGTTFIAAAGSVGGNLELTLMRPNSETAKYSISYQNTSFDADKNAIIDVLKTFETR